MAASTSCRIGSRADLPSPGAPTPVIALAPHLLVGQPTAMRDPSKSVDQSTLAGSKPRAKRDEAMMLIVGVRVLQVLFILVLWFVTSYYGPSCLGPFGYDHLATGGRRSQQSAPRGSNGQHHF